MALFGNKKNYSTITVKKREVPDGLWMKCPSCGEIVYKDEVAANLEVCTKCDHHFTLSRQARLDLLSDEEKKVSREKGFSLLDLQRVARARGYKAQGFRLEPRYLSRLGGRVIVFIEPRGYGRRHWEVYSNALVVHGTP